MTAPTWCPCAVNEAHIAVRGRLVGLVFGASTRPCELHVACVKCGKAQMPDGVVGSLERAEHLALSRLALPITYARDAIRRGVEVDQQSLPTVEQLSELGLVRSIRSEMFRDFRGAKDADVRAHMRGLFDIPDGASAVRLDIDGLRRAIVVGDDFVEHPFQEQRRLEDPDHMIYSVLTPKTVHTALEIFLVRDKERRTSFKFLSAYIDLSVPQDGNRSPYVYHVAYALGDGRLKTSFRLKKGAQAFRAEREGRLMYAAYAAPTPPATFSKAEIVVRETETNIVATSTSPAGIGVPPARIAKLFS